MPDTLTAEEIAQATELEAQQAPQEFNALRDLTADELASLAAEDTSFIIADEFAKHKDLWKDQDFVQKAADAQNKVKQRGFTTKDLPSVGTAAGAVGTAVKGLGKQLWNYAVVPGGLLLGAGAEALGADTFASEVNKDLSKRLASNIAGTEEAMTGISQLGEKGVKKLGRTLGITKDFSEYSAAEKVTDLFNEVGKAEVRGERLVGKGPVTEAVTHGAAAEMDLDPEEIATLAAGDPFSFFAFGRGAGLAGQGVKAVTPTAVKGALATGTRAVTQAAEKAIPFVAGKSVTGAAQAAKAPAIVVEKVAPVVGTVKGALAGAGVDFGTGGLSGGGGAAAGAYIGRQVGKGIAKEAKRVRGGLENIADLGRQISGNKAVSSAYAQGARDVLQAIPSATGDIAKGTALDLGLAAATAELPQDTEGAVGFGTALGALGAAGRVGRRAISGQLIAPRSYGIDKPVKSSGAFENFDVMHEDAFQHAPPGVKARVNAIRQFAESTAPGTDVFMARDAATMERALVASGVAPETARLWSEQNGLSTQLPDAQGNLRPVILLKDVDAAPHEAFHAIQDVLGEDANRRIDNLIRETYGPAWEAEGPKYAQRLGADPANWREAVLDATGWGDVAAKEKLYRDTYNEFVGKTGTEPAPRLVEEQVKARLGEIADAALERGQAVDPSEIGQRVWRDILAPEDIAEVSDRYIAREIAAENFDALLKSEGPALEGGKQIPQRLARILGGVISAFGGEPLAGRTSETGQVALRTPVVEAVRSAARGRQAAPEALEFTTQPRTAAERPVVPAEEPAGPVPRTTGLEKIRSDLAAEQAKRALVPITPKFKEIYEPKGPVPRTPQLQEILDAPVPSTPELDALRPITPPKKGTAKPPKPAVEPKAPEPPSSEAASLEARILAEDAPTKPEVGGTRSPRELLGQIAEAISAQEGVKLNYLSAPGEPAAAITSNRAARRAVIETFRTMPAEARALWEKTFFPEKVTKTKTGKYQIQGWAPEVFAANAHKLAKFLSETPEAQKLSPYAVDPKTGSFTTEAWKELYSDTQQFVENQARGATGAGEPLVVPRSVTEAGGFAPAVRGGTRALDQTKADMINMLFGLKLPETPRVQAGKRPLNVQGQEVSEATKPGRVQPPDRPRGRYEAEGVDIAEVNPLRNQLEAAAREAEKPMPSFIETRQSLNLENIKEVQGAPEQPQFRGNTLTLSAGFQPRDWRVSGQLRGEKTEITVKADDIAGARREAENQGMRVAKVEASDKFTNAMFQPAAAELIQDVIAADLPQLKALVGDNLTGAAIELGLALRSAEELAVLRAQHEEWSARAMDYVKETSQQFAAKRAAGDMDGATAFIRKSSDRSQELALKAQFFREAAEAATATGSLENVVKTLE